MEDEYMTDAAEVARRVLDLLPEARRTEACDVFVIEADDVVVLITPERLELRLPTVDWMQGTHGPKASTRLWRALLLDGLDADRLIEQLRAAQEARRSEWAVCEHCGRRVPVEYRHDEDGHICCQSCASAHHGVVY